VDMAPEVTRLLDQAAHGNLEQARERVMLDGVSPTPGKGGGPHGNCSLYSSIEKNYEDLTSDSCIRDLSKGHHSGCEPLPLHRLVGKLMGPVRRMQQEECLHACGFNNNCAGASFTLEEMPQIPGACVMYSSYTAVTDEMRSLVCVPTWKPTPMGGHPDCNFTSNLRVDNGTVLEQGVTVSARACCEGCNKAGAACAVANFFPFPPPGPPPSWQRKGPCDPKHCDDDVDTSHWFCGSLTGQGCQNISHDESQECPSDGYLACPGIHAGYGPPQVPGDRCGCSEYVGYANKDDDVLCVYGWGPKDDFTDSGSGKGHHAHCGAKCALPFRNGACPVGWKLCSRETPRLVLQNTPREWKALSSAVKKAANVTTKEVQVYSLCPKAACEPTCPHSEFLRWKAGCVNESMNVSALPEGGVVFDFDIAGKHNDNRTRQVALNVLITAAQIAANSTNETVVNSTQGAWELRQLGVQYVLLGSPPAANTDSSDTPAPPGGGGGGPSSFMGSTWMYLIIGVCCLAVLIGGVVARKVHWGASVNFGASRIDRKRGMEGCFRAHGARGARKEVNIDESDSQSRSTSSSDSEPEEDL